MDGVAIVSMSEYNRIQFTNITGWLISGMLKMKRESEETM